MARPTPAAPDGAALRINSLSLAYGEQWALRGIDVTLPVGGTLAVLGPNGAGKSTLLRIVATLLRPTEGEVEVLGQSLPREAWRLRGRIGYLGHQPLLYRDLDAVENLRFHARHFGLPDEGRERISELLELVSLSGRRGLRVDEMSAGMVKRLATCRALLNDPELLVLDEPLANLDPAGADVVAPLLGATPDRSRVLVTHDVEAALGEADRVLALDRRGRVAFDADVAEVDVERARAIYAERSAATSAAIPAAVSPVTTVERQASHPPAPTGGSGELELSTSVTSPAPADVASSNSSPAGGSDSRPPSIGAALRTILGKDLRVELRTLQSVPAMILFTVTIFVIFRFGLDRVRLEGSLASGVLIVTVLFAALLAINRLFVAEREQGGIEAIRLAPVDSTALFLAKAVALVVYLVVLELVAIPVFWVFFLAEGSGLLPLVAILLLLDVAFAAIGALISPMATNSRARDLIGPLIMLPLLVPALIAASGAGADLLAAGGPSYDGFGTWLAVLGLYDLIFLLIGWAAFDFLIED